MVLAKKKELEVLQEPLQSATDTSPTLPYNPEAALFEYECESQWRLCVTPRPKDKEETDDQFRALLRAKTLRLGDTEEEVENENEDKKKDGDKKAAEKEGEGDGGVAAATKLESPDLKSSDKKEDMHEEKILES